MYSGAGRTIALGRWTHDPVSAIATLFKEPLNRMNALPTSIARQLDELLLGPVFSRNPEERHAKLLAILQAELSYAIERHPPFRRYVETWPIDYRTAERIADLPYLPVGVFKADPPLTLVPPDKIVRTLASSATTGQSPSRVVLDTETSRRMVKGVTSIIRDFIGPTRRPYLVIDTPESLAGGAQLGARSAAIQGLRAFATDIVCCLKSDDFGKPVIDESKLLAFAQQVGNGDALAYGFTYIVWQHFVLPLRAKGITLRMPNVRLLHSGGWKRLQEQAVPRDAYAAGVASVFGCPADQIIDFYGMVENVGIIYPDCAHGNKHVPAFAEVIVRDPLTLEPVHVGKQGLVQVCSALSTSFPGFAVLTDDIAEIIHNDGCPCGRRGVCFRFVKRVPKAEVRGCGNIENLRQRASAA
jgi:Acyl-protein synthetase, LuxE